MTFTLAIGMGLSEAVLGRDPEPQREAFHVGRTEAERLMGAGREYGRGPLPAFLAQFELARRSGAPLGLILLDECAADGSRLSPAAPLEEWTRAAVRVSTSPRGVLWAPVIEAVRSISRTDPLGPQPDPLRFLLFGCHTDQQVLALALLLRSVLGQVEIVICPHLVASATVEAHLAVLRHHLPRAGVNVLLDLHEVADLAALDGTPLARCGCTACSIQPAELRGSLSENSLRILRLVCLHWTETQLRPLSGGFSGSLLLLASGWKGDARTEPMVIKVDRYPQMRREIDGYHQVKDLLGKHVPTFDYPVHREGWLGVGMELAAMEGSPTSLQDCFEAAESEAGLAIYLRRLDKALELIAGRLYRNTRRTGWISPYRAFHLDTELQQQWLSENVAAIERYWIQDVGTPLPVDPVLLAAQLRLLARNEDGVESDLCLAHGDLNFKNIICDEGDNIWFIDWTHCGRLPLELDFAKLENDVKFVMSKQFDLEDLSRMRRLEEYFLAQPLPADPEQLPEELRFARWDLRFRKVLISVRRIRQTCFALKHTESWLLYRAALLKYALHTLSFDRRRGRGECDLPQLVLALHSTDALLNDLVVDDFQLKIRGERPPDYPPRLRVSLDLAPWAVQNADYDPPYYVVPEVLANDRTRVEGGWADAEHSDSRPLHPFGRTGIAGRGALGRWGANPSVVALLTRYHSGRTEILLGARGDSDLLAPPAGFVRPGEDPEAALVRVLRAETGWRLDAPTVLVAEGYHYDPRQTDHAWVTAQVRHLHLSSADSSPFLQPGGAFESVAWYPLDPGIVARIPPGLGRYVRELVHTLELEGTLSLTEATAGLVTTG